LVGCTPAALDLHGNFLHGLPSYLLILWELADKHQLLSATLQRLADSVLAGDASSAPLTFIMRRGSRPSRPSPTFSENTEGTNNDFSKSLLMYNVDCSMRNVMDQLSSLY
jgi:hypothetical protein